MSGINLDKTYNLSESDIRHKLNTRNNFVYGVIGTNTVGKSPFAKKIAEWWKESRPGGTVVSFDPQNNFEKVSDMFIPIEDKDWAKKCLSLRDTLLILDDYRLINKHDRSVDGLMELLYFREKRNVDIIYICHNPMLVINDLTYFTTNYFIFLTRTKEGSFKDKIPNYTLCVTASKTVNKYVEKFGRGSYPNFPYIEVNCDKQKLLAYNMERINEM